MGEDMKILLAALNSQYCHSNPAVFALKNAIKDLEPQIDITMAQWNVNRPQRQLLREIYTGNYNIVAFSCYIWNVDYLLHLAADLKRIAPEPTIIFGGPQATAQVDVLSCQESPVDGVIAGEGEIVWRCYLQAVIKGDLRPQIKGLNWKGQSSYTKADPVDLATLDFLYDQEDLQSLQDKIVYYESSRGCPFACTFCVSAKERLHNRPIALVKDDLNKLANRGGQIKFVDRTFNAEEERAIQIIRHLLTLYRPGLSWHFEIEPDLLSESLIELFCQAPKGYFQVEAGIQSLSQKVLAAVGRKSDWQKVKVYVSELLKKDNLHLHLDLIAGLPYEDLNSFKEAFNQVHTLYPHHLQLGFLKVLPGSLLWEQVNAGKLQNYDLRYSQNPPYQVLSTQSMSAQDLFLLEQIAQVLDQFYNPGRFRQTLYFASQIANKDAWSFYLALLQVRQKYPKETLALADQYNLLYQLLAKGEHAALFFDLLRLDWLSYGGGAVLPEFLRHKEDERNTFVFSHRFGFEQNGLVRVEKEVCHAFFDVQKRERRPGVSGRVLMRYIEPESQ